MDILIIEDDKFLREAYHEILSLEGHTILSASNLKDAQDLLRNSGFDLVISDANLGNFDMFDMLCDMLYDIKLRGTQIMMISGSSSVQNTCQAYGFAFLQKPFSPTELLRVIPGV